MKNSAEDVNQREYENNAVETENPAKEDVEQTKPSEPVKKEDAKQLKHSEPDENDVDEEQLKDSVRKTLLSKKLSIY